MERDKKEVTDAELAKFVERLNKQRQNYKKYGKQYRDKQKALKQLCIERGLIEK